MSMPDPIVLLDARARYVHPAFQMSRASTKTVFDAAGRLVTVPPNALGWDHDPATGQARGYLAEPSATNLFLHSNDLTQGEWIKFGATVTGDAITGPDGQGMAKVVEGSDTSLHSVSQGITIGDGDTISACFIAKAGERESARLQLRQASDTNNNLRISVYLTGDGSFDAPTTDGTATVIDGGITHLGGGFYRVWLVGTLGSGITDARVEVRLLDGTGSASYQGDGTSGLYVGYCQAEEGSYPTSYIETGAATATRAGDRASLDIMGQPWWAGGSKGVFLVDVDFRDGNFVGDIISTRDDLRIECTGSGNARGCRLAGGMIDGFGALIPSVTTKARHRIAVAWGGGEVVCCADGSITDTLALQRAVEPTRNFVIGARPNTSGEGAFSHVSGPVPRVAYYPARISSATLQSLTAIQE